MAVMYILNVLKLTQTLAKKRFSFSLIHYAIVTVWQQ